MKNKCLLTLIAITGLIVPSLRAEGGGSGHYMPGASASFIDAFPGRTSLAVVPTHTYWRNSRRALSSPPRHQGRLQHQYDHQVWK